MTFVVTADKQHHLVVVDANLVYCALRERYMSYLKIENLVVAPNVKHLVMNPIVDHFVVNSIEKHLVVCSIGKYLVLCSIVEH